MSNTPVILKETHTLHQIAKIQSISLIHACDNEEFLHYTRQSRTVSSCKAIPRELSGSELFTIAASEHLDYPRIPLIVHTGKTCKVLLRSLLRTAGVLTVLNISNDVNTNIKDRHEGILIRPYCFISDSETSIKQYVTALADFIGCRLTVVDTAHPWLEATPAAGDTDVISILLFLLLELLSRTSDENGILLEINQHANVQALRLHAVLRRGTDIINTAEFTECMRISELRNATIDYFISEDNTVSIEFYVKDVEWSHLGIKARQQLEYDR